MAELAEWSAQALRCQGSDVPVKVVYIQSREVAETSDSCYQYRDFGLPEQSAELSKQTPHGVSRVSDLQDFFSGFFFALGEVLNSKVYTLQRNEDFEDKKSTFEDLLSKSKNISRVVPFDPQAGHEPKFSDAKPKFIEPSEEDLPWNLLLDNAINGKHIEANRTYRQGERKGGEWKRKEAETRRDGGEFKRKKEKVEEKEKEDEEKKREERLKKRKEVSGMINRDVRLSKRCALISGIITEFNPSGMWIVEELLNDEEEVK